MKGLNKKIQMHFEGLVNELKKTGGECIIILQDNEHDKGADAVMALTPESSAAMLAELFSRNPDLIPKALAALAMVTDDCDFDEDDDDGPDDDPDEDPIDGTPVLLEACMN